MAWSAHRAEPLIQAFFWKARSAHPAPASRILVSRDQVAFWHGWAILGETWSFGASWVSSAEHRSLVQEFLRSFGNPLWVSRIRAGPTRSSGARL